MGSKESIIYQALLIVIALFLLVVTAFVIAISRYRKKSQAAYFKKVRMDFSTIENDRKHTATNLHDGLGSYLSAIRLLTDEALEKAHANEDLKKQIDVTFQKTFLSLRSILGNMIPRTLQREGLLAAVEEQVALLFPAESVTVRIKVIIDLNTIKEETLLHIYRILQELLTNVQKHAEASHVVITFQRKERFLFIEIRDNGKGFNNSRIENNVAGFGLASISDRILLLRGESYLETSPGKGTSYQMLLPVL